MKYRAADSSETLGGVHPEIAHLSWLVGGWRGASRGQMPNGDSFLFEQEAQFFTDGRPFLEYRSYSWIMDEDRNRLFPSHTEQGYWRGGPDNAVEFLVTNPLGVCEIYTGKVIVGGLENATITRTELQLTTSALTLSPTAHAVTSASRMYGLVGGRLLTTFDMGMSGADGEPHVWISMEKFNG